VGAHRSTIASHDVQSAWSAADQLAGVIHDLVALVEGSEDGAIQYHRDSASTPGGVVACGIDVVDYPLIGERPRSDEGAHVPAS
jgi:hypothetical protein